MKDQNQQGGSQSQGSQSSQGKSQRSQSELETIIRGGQFTSQQQANDYLQKHGLSCQMKDDGTADIFEGTQQRVASVQFSGQQGGNTPRQISGINY